MEVLLADDQILFRSMLEEVLKKDSEFQVIGAVANGDEAVKKTLELKPDLVLLDIQMPIKSGVEALIEIKEKLPSTKVVMLTTFEDKENIIAAYLAGADGYLVKDMKPEVLTMSLKCIFNNLAVLHQSVHEYLQQVQKIQKIQQTKGDDEKITFGDIVFNGIDVEIIKLIAEGQTNKEIAQCLNYSEGTIKNKVSNILNATGLADRTKICVFAIKNSII